MWELLLVGLVITSEPLPIVAFILVLSTEKGTRNGLGFIAGWVLCLVTIIVLTLAASGGEPPAPKSPPAQLASIAAILVGVFLLGIAARQRRRMQSGPRPPRPPPKWMTKVDTMSVWATASLAILLQPWPFVAAGAALVVDASISSSESLVYLILFCIVATASLITMELYMVIAHDKATAKLAALRKWIESNRDKAIIILALVAGIALTAKGIYQLVA